MTIEQFFGTLLESVTVAHRFHLATGKFSSHKALNDYYDDAPDVIDDLIEAYQGIYGKITPLRDTDLPEDDAVVYFEALRDLIKENTDLFDDDDTEVLSCLDDVTSLVDSTLYKLRELKESRGHRSLYDFVIEACSDCCAKKPKKLEEDEDSGEVESEEDFRAYAENKFKEVFGDKLDKERMKMTIDGLIDDNPDLVEKGKWGELVGMLNKSFGA